MTESNATVRLEDGLGAAVTLRDVEDQDGYGSVRFLTVLEARGLHAEAQVSSYESPEDGLAALLEALAGQWRGWDGTRTWNATRSLRVDARHDRGYAHLRFTLQERRDADGWTASVEIRLAPGEDLSAAAAAVTSLLRPSAAPPPADGSPRP